jgi:hypothetical protein
MPIDFNSKYFILMNFYFTYQNKIIFIKLKLILIKIIYEQFKQIFYFNIYN